MRRVHLRRRENILKRLLVHVGGFNLGLVMRVLVGKGTPRGFQGTVAGLWKPFLVAWEARCGWGTLPTTREAPKGVRWRAVAIG